MLVRFGLRVHSRLGIGALFVLLIQEFSSCDEIACRLGGWFSWSSSLPILHLVSLSSSCARTSEACPHSRDCFETGRGRGCAQGAFPEIASVVAIVPGLWLQLCLCMSQRI